MLVSKAQYYEESTSICRNTTLQKMFMQIGSAEKAGSGVDKILAGWRFANWRAPMLRLLTQPDIVELTMMMESLMDDATKEKLIHIFGSKVFTIGHERLLALNAAGADGYVTNESLRIVLGIHKAEIADLLKDMCKNHLLVQDGYGRGTKYYLPKEGSNITSSSSKVASSSPNIASTTTKRRLSYEELRNIICLNSQDWLSLEELSVLVKRDKIYLRNFIIPRMLADKSLEMMFPGVPKHPCQKYKSLIKGNNEDKD